MQQATRAAQDPAMRDSIMSMDELESLWSSSKPGSVKIFMIQARGLVEEPDGSGSSTSKRGAAQRLQQRMTNALQRLLGGR